MHRRRVATALFISTNAARSQNLVIYMVTKDLGIFITMTRFVHPLLLLIAKFTNKELARVVEYLLAEA